MVRNTIALNGVGETGGISAGPAGPCGVVCCGADGAGQSRRDAGGQVGARVRSSRRGKVRPLSGFRLHDVPLRREVAGRALSHSICHIFHARGAVSAAVGLLDAGCRIMFYKPVTAVAGLMETCQKITPFPGK